MAKQLSESEFPTNRRDWARTAATLAEALPHIQAHEGKIVVIKFGGAAMGDESSLARFALDVTLIRQCGVRPVVVHGGGPQINHMLDRLGIESEFVGGQRVTTAAAAEVVEMVLVGSVNKRIVTAIHRQGGRAIGLSGKDAKLICAEKLAGPNGEDLGFVGEPTRVASDVLLGLLQSDLIPVIAPIAWGPDGATYNVNADTAAGAVAAATKADRLLYLTDVPGVLNGEGKVIEQLSANQVETLVADGTVARGMIPKLRTATHAVEHGVQGAVILDGRTPHATLLELFTDHGAGTMIINST